MMSNQPQGKIAVTKEDGEQSTDGMGGVIVVGDSMKEGNPEVDDDQSKFVTNHSMEKSFSQTKLQSDQKQLAVSIGNLSLQKGITSSPSFQELERAIGATLAMSDSAENLEAADSPKYGGLHYSNSSPRSFDMNAIAHQKRQSQMLKMQRPQMTQYGSRNLAPAVQHSNPILTANARAELGESFINEDESRAIILFHSPHISAVTVRDACQKFGVLYYIRPEFHGKGVTLLSYFDLRSAVHAKNSLAEDLGVDAEASAHYSVMLHATNNNSEEFRLVVRHLPPGRAEADIQSIFSRYGQLRSIQRTFEDEADNVESSGSSSVSNSSVSGTSASTSYSVEYYNIQDSRLAASELCATSATIWGPDAQVTFAPLDSRKQLLCRKLLATLSRWRAELAASTTYPAPSYPMPMQHLYQHQGRFPTGNMEHGSTPLLLHPGLAGGYMQAMPMQLPLQMMQYSIPMQPVQYQQQLRVDLAQQQQHHQQLQTNLPAQKGAIGHQHRVDSTDGLMSDSQSLKFRPTDVMSTGMEPDRMLQQSPYKLSKAGHLAINQQTFPVSASLAHVSARQKQATTALSINPIIPAGIVAPLVYEQRPHHHNGGHGHGRRSVGGRMSSSNQSTSTGAPSVEAEFTLDIERLKEGMDTRTTVMVRNIPNKYNQTMLLEEVNVNHEGTYDFFYLPIDFKNKCNVGYCFINFLDHKFILPFFEEFNGQRWKSFNSEKVCAVSFARIQGKAAMVSRFQNSSLLEKDDEYRPLLFYSSGPEKGQPEPFPSSRRSARNLQTNLSDPTRVELIGPSKLIDELSPSHDS